MRIYTESRTRETSQPGRWFLTISSSKWKFTNLFYVVLIMSMTSTLMQQVYSYTTPPNSVNLTQDLHISTGINTHPMSRKPETAVSHEIIRQSRRMLLDSSSRARPAPRSFPPPQGNALVITPARRSPPSKPYGERHQKSDPSSHNGDADHLNPPPHP